MGKGLFDKNKEDDRYFNQHEHATLMEGRIPGSWMIQNCDHYYAEWKACKSFKGKFYQYYMDGEMKDCKTLKDNYDDCRFVTARYDEEACKRLVDREKLRMEERLKTHKENDVWEPRTSPPEDWNKPLPPEIAKMAENSLFQKYTDNGGELPEEEKEGYAKKSLDDPFKCYIGELEVTKDTTKEEKETKPELGVCENIYHNLCVSFATNVVTDNTSTIAGSWGKYCSEQGSGLATIFGEGVTDGCVELPAEIGTTIMCVCSTEGCNQKIELDATASNAMQSVVSFFPIVLAMTVFILNQ